MPVCLARFQHEGKLGFSAVATAVIERSIMAYNRNQARALLSAAEYELFEASLADHIGTLTPAQLKSKVQRTRRLRDKQRDLLQRQRLASRARSGSKSGSSGVANARTGQKAQVFDEALTRFEKRAAQLDKQAAAAARRASALNAAAARKPAKSSPKSAKPAGGKPTRTISAKARRTLPKDGAELPGKKHQMGKDRFRAVLGHVSASGRRAQGRRDSR
jgi:hypothetical protein